MHTEFVSIKEWENIVNFAITYTKLINENELWWEILDGNAREGLMYKNGRIYVTRIWQAIPTHSWWISREAAAQMLIKHMARK